MAGPAARPRGGRANELPEKVNSVPWVRRGRDTLAVGNITGAMTFQSTVAVALGLVITDWSLDRYAVIAGCVALCGGALSLWIFPRRGGGLAPGAVWAGLLAGFVAYVALS